MTPTTSMLFSRHRRAVAGLALAAACTSASALSAFTLDPAAVGLAGSAFTGDNFQTADYSTLRFDNLGHFTDTGFLSVSAVELGGATIAPAGLNAASGLGYSLYFAFSGAGDATTGLPINDMTAGKFSSLNYTLYAFDGVASFGFDANNNPTTSAAGQGVVLATGSLMPAGANLPSSDGSKAVPFANGRLSFNPAPDRPGFFVAPTNFYSIALAAFANTLTSVQAFDGAFRMFTGQGAQGGSVNFGEARPLPEPSTAALMFAGLAATGLALRRRRPH